MRKNESGFILLYSMLLVLCLSGFSLYLVQQYEMEKKLLAYELEQTQVKQLTYSAVSEFIDKLPGENSVFIERQSDKYGDISLSALKKNEVWEVSVLIKRGEYSKQRYFVYDEEENKIQKWKEWGSPF